jgi:anti-anti-sigma factor
MLEVSADQRFRCDVLPEREVVRVVPRGELDLATAPLVERELEHLLGAGFRHVVLELTQLTFIDSTGLRLLIAARRSARERQALLEIVPGSHDVQRIFELTGTESMLFD